MAGWPARGGGQGLFARADKGSRAAPSAGWPWPSFPALHSFHIFPARGRHNEGWKDNAARRVYDAGALGFLWRFGDKKEKKMREDGGSGKKGNRFWAQKLEVGRGKRRKRKREGGRRGTRELRTSMVHAEGRTHAKAESGSRGYATIKKRIHAK